MLRSENYQYAKLFGSLCAGMLAAILVDIYVPKATIYLLATSVSLLLWLIWRRRPTVGNLSVRFGVFIFAVFMLLGMLKT